MRTLAYLLALGWLASTPGSPAVAGPVDGPMPPAQATASPGSKPLDAPISVFLDTPADRDAFWKGLARPDFVILDGDLYRKLRRGSEGNRPPADAAPPAVVDSIAVDGEVEGDWARLRVDLRVTMAADGPAWVPIQLDGLTLSAVREGDRDLGAKVGEDRSWLIELAGKGGHAVRVELIAPVRTTADGRRLELATPPAASTRVGLDVRQTVLDAATGPGEPLAVAPVEDKPGVARLAARLSPRSRLEVGWRERSDPSIKLPVVLSAQGEIAVEVERGSIKARSSWIIAAVRGTTGRLTLRLDPAEEILEVEVDGRPVQVEAGREAGRPVLAIPLAEPLRAASPRNVTIATRRPIAADGTARVLLQGYPIDGAKVQAGILAVARTGPLFLNPTVGRGLRRIDPRTELPESLRSRHDTALAFEFNDQPFELNLAIDPAPPRITFDSRATVEVGPHSARVDCYLDCRVAQGRAFEVRVGLPRGLVFESAGPPEVVASAQVVAAGPRPGVAAGPDVPRSLVVALNRQAKEADAFTIHLTGRASFDATGPVAIPLFQGPADSANGGRVAVLGERDVSVELAEAVDGPGPFRADPEVPPAGWAWPAGASGRSGVESARLWLRCDASPERLPLRVTARPRAVRHESTMAVAVDGRGADVVDEVSGEVASGGLTRLDVVFPPEIPARWDLQGAEPAGRELIGREPDGSRRYRLSFARELAGAFRLRFRYRVDFAGPPTPGRDSKLRLAPIRIAEGTSTGRAIRLAAGPGLDVRASGEGWSPAASPGPGPDAAEDGEAPVRLVLASAVEEASAVEVLVREAPRAGLPTTVASRLWIKTVQRAEGDLSTSAYYWLEARDGSITLDLPPGSRWARARVGGADLAPGDVDLVAADRYRLRFPASTAPGPLLVGVDYVVPAASAAAAAAATSGGWRPPELRDGVVQQTLWEVRLVGPRAGIGVPSGWADENEWFWDGLIWRRRPSRGPVELSLWATGGGTRYRLADPLEATGQAAGRHGYLFSRPGPPSPLRFPIYSRSLLLLLCSGPALIAGLLVLARRPPPRLVGASLLPVAFALGAWLEPNATIQILQSSILGVALLIAAMAMHWALDRRPGGRPAGGRGRVDIQAIPVSSLVIGPQIGSDDSTAIRPRPGASAASTADHIVLSRAAIRGADAPSKTDHNLR